MNCTGQEGDESDCKDASGEQRKLIEVRDYCKGKMWHPVPSCLAASAAVLKAAPRARDPLAP